MKLHIDIFILCNLIYYDAKIAIPHDKVPDNC